MNQLTSRLWGYVSEHCRIMRDSCHSRIVCYIEIFPSRLFGNVVENIGHHLTVAKRGLIQFNEASW